ncbi:hypothetical protein [Mucilaginibacter agri]|uniref:Uncharacterized protein n=1 Tax=Mucilaginibacter agri TaxID=2695265 RepID=A0A966DTK4_9SPHI|nr:hypothetical protein [Mucilaginibacter agri]NCD69427.1 hypothetical protein [Mucilaginibacter agri]
MMDITVRTISDLHSEIIRLEKLKQQQEIDLKQRFSSPSSIFSIVKSFFPRSNKGGSSILDQDFLGLISRVALPFTLNRTLFKGSGFLVKTLVGLVSQKASTYISEDSVTGVWDKAKGLITGLLSKKNKKPAPAPEPDFSKAS